MLKPDALSWPGPQGRFCCLLPRIIFFLIV
jgi:hypothetical protein